MSELTSWKRFLKAREGRPPLSFVTGLRNKVSLGVCCVVHSHREIEIVYHPTGCGVTRMGQEEIAFTPGSVIVYPPRQPHDQVMEEAGEDLCVQIAIPEGTKFAPGSTIHVAAPASSFFAETVKALARGYSGLAAAERTILDLRATALLMELIHAASVREAQGTLTEGELHVARAERYIAEHFGRIDSLGEVAAAVGVSHDHLRHLFKAMRGRSLIRHLNEVRMERAKTLLVQSILPLKQVSALCGFADEYYFSAVFRRLAGVTPGGYRRAGRQALAKN